MNLQDKLYKNWLAELKGKIHSAQIKAALAINSALIHFYWELGKMIAEKENVWGSKLIDQVAKDLQEAFPKMKGLSRSNLFYCKQFYLFYHIELVQQAVGQLITNPQPGEIIGQPPTIQLQTNDNQTVTTFLQHITQIPWGHNILIFTKSKDTAEALFFAAQTIENNWSRSVLALQIQSGLYERKGKAVSNFKNTLPQPMSDLAQQTLKDPYIFDFLTLAEGYKERDIEQQLVKHVTRFLLELGKGFAFVGQQYYLKIGENDYYLDLLFYHIRLKCYVVIELKNTKFVPEYTGKLNFYLSAVDSLVKQADDNPTIGILLCRYKNNIEAEFALRDINKPMGVSEFQITEVMPEDLKSSLPTIEEIENEFNNPEV
jgi:predicted nuclease of restriction endonuclease-like (RecB) superfamily